MSELATPAVTVIIPTYNWSSVLPYSIGSVLGQSFTDFELLVVGDGCTDDSEQVVTSIPDPRVRWINLPQNTGQQSGPNNEGLLRARGAVIAYLGHDDLWLPHHLACLTTAIAAGTGLAFGVTARILADGHMEAAPVVSAYHPGMWLPPTGAAHRRDIVLDIGGWRHYRELVVDPETDLWDRIHSAGHFVTIVPRLTALKFPAARRKDVYRIKPCHEQAEWSERIRAEPAIEAVVLAQLVIDTERRLAEVTAPGPYWRVVRQFLAETHTRLRSRLKRAPPAPTPGSRIDEIRRFKGL